MSSDQFINELPTYTTSHMIYTITRAVIETIGKSDQLAQDKISNMVKRILIEKASEVHQ